MTTTTVMKMAMTMLLRIVLFHVTSETLPIQSLAFCGLSGQLKKRTQNNKTMIAMVFANTFTKKRTKN